MAKLDNDFSRFVDSYKIPTISTKIPYRNTQEASVDNAKYETTGVDHPNAQYATANTQANATTDTKTNSDMLDWSNLDDRTRILDAQQFAESNYDPLAESNKKRDSKYRAKGIAQIMDDTWSEAQSRGWASETDSPFDADTASHVQYKYMNWISERPYISSASTSGDKTRRMLAAYNVGIGNVKKAVEAAEIAGKPDNWMDFLSATGEAKYKEVSGYVPKIIARAKDKSFKPTREWDYSRKFGGILYNRSKASNK